MPEDNPPAPPMTPLDKAMRYGLFVVAAACVLAGIARSLGFRQFDETSMKFFGVGAAILVLHQFTKIKLPGVELERVREVARAAAKSQAEESVAPIAKRVELFEKESPLPGKKDPELADVSAALALGTSASVAPTPSGATPAKAATASAARPETAAANLSVNDWESDPNLGRFGGSPRANGRELSAVIEPAIDGRSAACDVTLTVVSTDPSRQLTGRITFYLHPTFGRSKRTAIAKDGKAGISFTSWGAFTVGVEADDAATKLELNLMNVRGGTNAFYKN